MRRVGLSLLAAASVLAAGPALAQAPQVEKNVSMAMALAIIQGTLEQCTRDGYKVSVTDGGQGRQCRGLAARRRHQSPHHGIQPHEGLHLAHPQPDLAGIHEADSDPANAFILNQIPDVVAVGGGVPIKVGNEVIGGVGASGAPGGEKDELCVMNGIAKVADALK